MMALAVLAGLTLACSRRTETGEGEAATTSYSMPESERQILLDALAESRKGDLEALFVSRAGPPTVRQDLIPKQQQDPSAISLLYMVEWKDRRLTGTDSDLSVQVFFDPKGRLKYAATNWAAAREVVARLERD